MHSGSLASALDIYHRASVSLVPVNIFYYNRTESNTNKTNISKSHFNCCVKPL